MEQQPANEQTTGTDMKYDYWALKDKEFFKGVDKPITTPQLVGQNVSESKKYVNVT